jgi:hypothetical protein
LVSLTRAHAQTDTPGSTQTDTQKTAHTRRQTHIQTQTDERVSWNQSTESDFFCVPPLISRLSLLARVCCDTVYRVRYLADQVALSSACQVQLQIGARAELSCAQRREHLLREESCQGRCSELNVSGCPGELSISTQLTSSPGWPLTAVALLRQADANTEFPCLLHRTVRRASARERQTDRQTETDRQSARETERDWLLVEFLGERLALHITRHVQDVIYLKKNEFSRPKMICTVALAHKHTRTRTRAPAHTHMHKSHREPQSNDICLHKYIRMVMMLTYMCMYIHTYAYTRICTMYMHTHAYAQPRRERR